MDVLEQAREIIEQMQQAITAAEAGDWDKTRNIIDNRDRKLQQLLKHGNEATTEQQYKLRELLETLQQLNDRLTRLAIDNRDQIASKKTELQRGKQAINQYLDHSRDN